jgi:hypothetical protein
MGKLSVKLGDIKLTMKRMPVILAIAFAFKNLVPSAGQNAGG